MREPSLNVLGEKLVTCSKLPITGYFRDGCCNTSPEDIGCHTVCSVMTEEFLVYSQQHGNDLITPRPQLNFPGLSPGDQWCLCAERWVAAYKADCAPPVILAATHQKTLEHVSLETLRKFAFDQPH